MNRTPRVWFAPAKNPSQPPAHGTGSKSRRGATGPSSRSTTTRGDPRGFGGAARAPPKSTGVPRGFWLWRTHLVAPKASSTAGWTGHGDVKSLRTRATSKEQRQKRKRPPRGERLITSSKRRSHSVAPPKLLSNSFSATSRRPAIVSASQLPLSRAFKSLTNFFDSSRISRSKALCLALRKSTSSRA